MSENKILHRVLRRLASWAVWSFFSEIHIIGEENVPADGPMIVVATHHNMMLDPAVLSTNFPRKRMLNYWTKASLFANPILRYVLLSSGNIPVERKSKDKRVLFKGTFEVLARGEAVALFPEGTSYTEPRIMQVKDGASWSALEYMKWAKENPDKATSKELVLVPAAIVYTNKSKYRSEVIIEFGEPISLKQYEAQFLSPIEGEPRIAVKRLTQRIEAELIRATINAPDWDTLYVARMARSLLWEKSKSIDLNDFVAVSQTLVDLFSTPDATTNITQVKRRLLEYYSLLQSSKLNNSALSSLPLPKTLDPRRPEPIPSRLRTLLVLLRDTLSVLVRLPFFLFPLLVHLPAYLASRAAARLVEDEEETQAQNKIVVGLILMIMIYPAAFFFLWALFWYTPVGAVVSATTVWLFAVYHVKMIDNVYDHAKQLVAAWRVLVGIWSPRKTELSMTALQQYLVPKVPPESPWIDKNKKVKQPPESESQSQSFSGRESSAAAASSSSTSESPTPTPTPTPTPAPNDKFNSKGRKRRPPTRRLIRHVLRARSQAVHALATFFAELERQPEGKRFYASSHLAQLYGSFSESEPSPGDAKVDVDPTATPPPSTAVTTAATAANRQGWRSSREVLTFLRTRGARIATLESQIAEDYWAASSGALLSDGDAEGEGGEGETEYSYNSYSSDNSVSVRGNEGDEGSEDIKWVAPMIQ